MAKMNRETAQVLLALSQDAEAFSRKIEEVRKLQEVSQNRVIYDVLLNARKSARLIETSLTDLVLGPWPE